MAYSEICEIPYKELEASKNEEEDYLGQGGFGIVLRCYHKQYGSVAVKLMKSSDRVHILKEKCDSGFFNIEVSLHKKAYCENIVRVIGYTRNFQVMGIVLEYMAMGSLHDIISAKVELPWSFKIKTIYEISCAINHLHNLNVHSRMTHNDLKPENILFDANLKAKVSDFGGASFGKHTSIQTSATTTTETTTKGAKSNAYTLVYAAPELLKGDVPRTCSMDVYSFSLIIFCIVYQQKPYHDKSNELIRNAIEKNQKPAGDTNRIKFLSNIDEYTFDSLISTMKRMWDYIPSNRPKIREIWKEFDTLLELYPNVTINKDVELLKQKLQYTILPESDKNSRVNIIKKYNLVLHKGVTTSREAITLTPQVNTYQENNTLTQTVETTDSHSNTSQNMFDSPNASCHDFYNVPPARQNLSHSPATSPRETTVPSNNLIKLLDPNIKVDDRVVVKFDTSSKLLENFRNMSGEDISQLRGKSGRIVKVLNEELFEVCINDKCHTIHFEFLEKVQSNFDLSVGDVVSMSLPKEVVQEFQKYHGGWTDDMEKYHDEPGLVFRFFTNNSDVLVIYRDGSHFRFNPSALEKVAESIKCKFLKSTGALLAVGDFVYFNMEIDMIKQFQDGYGGWAEEMKALPNKVGIVVYVDYCARVYVAYSSKLCFMFNPVIFIKISQEEAVTWISKVETKEKRAIQTKLLVATRSRPSESNIKIGDKVKICLPVDIVIPLQKGNGGWLFQMFEAYGKCCVVKGFNHDNDVQISYGNPPTRWTFCRAVLAKYNTAVDPDYMPPFLVGDRVKVNIEKDHPGISENELIYQLQQLDFSDEKIDVLTQCGKVVGMDISMNVVVELDSGKKYGLSPKQLKKV